MNTIHSSIRHCGSSASFLSLIARDVLLPFSTRILLKQIAPLLLTLGLSQTATAASRCDSIITRDLERCAKENFESSDRKLNVAYRTLGPRLSPQQREMLLASQREWIIYKDKSCRSVYNGTAPGEEAGIEKWTCLDELTKTRLRELQYVDFRY
ncbi:lysozyme inhibitor LprI family protein [Paraburkholderia sp. RL17-337-BIB-A]|uniref:lysozyme inhibitor LprI family protein n=1 Tax=Paraburkholderia sp. RL17-337-BIB-A TaxID=3031636 RepID=UPI0038BCF63C